MCQKGEHPVDAVHPHIEGIRNEVVEIEEPGVEGREGWGGLWLPSSACVNGTISKT